MKNGNVPNNFRNKQTKKGCNQKESQPQKVTIKKRGGQPGNRNAAGHGAPYGNKNALGHGAPIGNKNALKHGFYSTYFIPTSLDDIVVNVMRDSGDRMTVKRFLEVRQELMEYIRNNLLIR